MGLIRLQNVFKQFGERMVLSDLSLDLHTGQIVGLVGANGAGKTTILRLIAGLLAPDMGTVTISKGLEVGYLPQEPEISVGQTLHDEVLSVFAEVLALEQKLHELSEQIAAAAPANADPDRDPTNPNRDREGAEDAKPLMDARRSDHDRGPGSSSPAHASPQSPLADLMAQYDRIAARFEAAGGYKFEQRLCEILGGLGFTVADYKLPMAALSGGQKCRAALAKLLLNQSEYLLLDEPTNHLDIDAVRWLEKFLAGHHGGALIISHDRYLLDRLADRIVAVDVGRTFSYPGNYSNYVQAKAVRDLTQERQYEQDKAFIEKERAFIAKHLAGQRTAEAKGRRTRLQRRLEAGEFTLEKPSQRDKVKIRFDADVQQVSEGKNALEIAGLAKQYGDKVLFADLSLAIEAGRRLGITGPNGTGKTTLLKIVLGEVPADAGTHRFSPKATLGYFAQETTGLDPERTIVQEILDVRPDLLESHARSYAARFLFRGDDPFKRIGQLSGGEQSRVRLMKLILKSPNVLVLDEPTNHLDIPSREVLEEALSDFPGTIIAVSHDRYFLDRICDRLLVMRLGEDRLFQGNYSAYIAQVEREQAEAQAAAAAEEAAARAARARRPGRGGGTSRGKSDQPRSRFARLKLDELEALIMDRETKLAELHQRFGDPQLYQDGDQVLALRQEFEAIHAELEKARAEWDARAEAEHGD